MVETVVSGKQHKTLTLQKEKKKKSEKHSTSAAQVYGAEQTISDYF